MDSSLKSNILEDNKHIFDELEQKGHRILLLGLGGSYAYGTNVETSDIDVRGIYSNSVSELLGVENDKEQYMSDEIDTTIYSLQKAVKLISQCNPAMIELLGCRKEDYIYVSDEGRMLIDNVHLFLSKRAINTFGGYARSQLNRLINRSGRAKDMLLENEERSFEKAFLSLSSRYKHTIKNPEVRREDPNLYLSFAVENMPVSEVAALLNEFNSIDRGYRKSVRNDKAAAHNKLSKHMMHLIRLYIMGIEIMTEHVVHTYRGGEEHELLMSIRNGDYLESDGITPTEEFQKLVDHYSSEYDKACEATTLPDEPDLKQINELMIQINKRFI